MSIFSIPQEMNIKIFYNLSPEEILDKCTIDTHMSDLCDDDNFWESYVKNRYDPNYYAKYIDLADYGMDIWYYLMNKAHRNSIFSNMNAIWRNLALWLEGAKPMSEIYIEDSRIVWSTIAPISKYDKIGQYAHTNGGQLYGDLLTIRNVNGVPVIYSLNDEFIGDDDFPIISNDTLIGDININNLSLFDYIDTVVSDTN